MNPPTLMVSHRKNLHRYTTPLLSCPGLILRAVRNKPSFSCFLEECILCALQFRELGNVRKNTHWPTCPFEKDGLWCRQITVSPQKKTLFRVTCTFLVLIEQLFKSPYCSCGPFYMGLVLASLWPWRSCRCFRVLALSFVEASGKTHISCSGSQLGCGHEACNESCLHYSFPKIAAFSEVVVSNSIHCL